jgi:hypothetical protein
MPILRWANTDPVSAHSWASGVAWPQQRLQTVACALSPGDVTGAPPTITQVRRPADASRPACQRVLSAVSDIVLDVEACAVNVTDQASQITQKMTAKVKS